MWGACRPGRCTAASPGCHGALSTLADLERAVLAKLGRPGTATGDTREAVEESDLQIRQLALRLPTTGVAACAVVLWQSGTRQADRGIHRH